MVQSIVEAHHGSADDSMFIDALLCKLTLAICAPLCKDVISLVYMDSQ